MPEQKAEASLPRAADGFRQVMGPHAPRPWDGNRCLVRPAAGQWGGTLLSLLPPPQPPAQGLRLRAAFLQPTPAPNQGSLKGPGEVPPTPLTRSPWVGMTSCHAFMSQMGKLRSEVK